MDIERDISRMKEIIEISSRHHPEHLNGLLIRETFINEFYGILDTLFYQARKGVEYWKQIIENAHKSQEANHDFITSLCEGVSKGEIKFG